MHQEPITEQHQYQTTQAKYPFKTDSIHSRREVLLGSGEILSRILIDRGERAFGSIVEMQLKIPSAFAIVGSCGYLGIIDHGNKKIFDFQTGSAACRTSFEEVYGGLALFGYERITLKNKLFGRGDDSEVISTLEKYAVLESVSSAINDEYTPNVYLKMRGVSQRDWDARKLYQGFNDSTHPIAKALFLIGANHLSETRTSSDGNEAIDWKQKLQKAKENKLV